MVFKSIVPIICLITLLFFSFYVVADDRGERKGFTLLEEDFENEFPPEGWRLIQTNPDSTWQQGSVEFDGSCLPHDGNKLAYIEAEEDQAYDEQLITPLLTLSSQMESADERSYTVHLWAYIDDYDYHDDPLKIDYRCNTANSPWNRIEFIPGDTLDPNGLSQINFSTIDEPYDCYYNGIYFRFRYVGGHDHGVCIDSIKVVYSGIFYYDESDDDDSGCCG
ncbi:MAG: choice-of-anchor J domain-containing protein [Candidatus Alcyoniella australis]|nr:choice-of-anchor J domain-containing protein [Candidatus Alcyoniella australis]